MWLNCFFFFFLEEYLSTWKDLAKKYEILCQRKLIQGEKGFFNKETYGHIDHFNAKIQNMFSYNAMSSNMDEIEEEIDVDKDDSSQNDDNSKE